MSVLKSGKAPETIPEIQPAHYYYPSGAALSRAVLSDRSTRDGTIDDITYKQKRVAELANKDLLARQLFGGEIPADHPLLTGNVEGTVYDPVKSVKGIIYSLNQQIENFKNK